MYFVKKDKVVKWERYWLSQGSVCDHGCWKAASYYTLVSFWAFYLPVSKSWKVLERSCCLGIICSQLGSNKSHFLWSWTNSTGSPISFWDSSWSSLWINRAGTDGSHTSWSKLLQVIHSAVAQDCCSKFLENLALAGMKQHFDNAVEWFQLLGLGMCTNTNFPCLEQLVFGGDLVVHFPTVVRNWMLEWFKTIAPGGFTFRENKDNFVYTNPFPATSLDHKLHLSLMLHWHQIWI